MSGWAIQLFGYEDVLSFMGDWIQEHFFNTWIRVGFKPSFLIELIVRAGSGCKQIPTFPPLCPSSISPSFHHSSIITDTALLLKLPDKLLHRHHLHHTHFTHTGIFSVLAFVGPCLVRTLTRSWYTGTRQMKVPQSSSCLCLQMSAALFPSTLSPRCVLSHGDGGRLLDVTLDGGEEF